MPHVEPLREGDPASVGRYRLAGRLGAGAQGVVYLAQAPNGAPVAVKVLHEGLAGDDRLAREMAAARQVDPVNVAQVLDASVSGRPYVVSEYVDGLSLQQAGPQAGAELQRLAVATATALAAIHRAGLVHRDFKPAGVLLGPGGPRVIGFGVTGALDSKLSATSNVVGTPAYMAPEQLAGQAVGPAADVFAWGSVIVFAATGVPPFGDDSLPAVINRILRAEPHLGELPQPLRAAVARCLTKDPAGRPTMHEVLLHLLGDPASSSSSPGSPGTDPHGTHGDAWHTAPQTAVRQEPISQSTDPVRPVTGPQAPVWPPAATTQDHSFDTPQPSPAPSTPRPGASGPSAPGPSTWDQNAPATGAAGSAAAGVAQAASWARTADHGERWPADGGPEDPWPQDGTRRGPWPQDGPRRESWPQDDSVAGPGAAGEWQPEPGGKPAPAAPRRRRGKTMVIAAASGLTALALGAAIVWLTPSSPQPRSQSLVGASSSTSPTASPSPSRKRPTRTRTPAPAHPGTADPVTTRSADPDGTVSPTAGPVTGRLTLTYVRAVGTREGTCWAGDHVALTALVERAGDQLPFGYVWMVDGRVTGRATTVVAPDGRLVLNAPRTLAADGGTHLVTLRITTPVSRQRSLSVTFCPQP
ncbi:protein kinase [Nonomuraea sp. 3-1Str]|uniref:serine/threonine-protein kinase n=1 Tax=Nonomuraea sp. 3-1Str TaxID=2929801 RepID=UPI00285722E8|nr:protein kinase [Nonomuraea sp. 3-1Str]MDR8413331.1 protein kinase [Nonomuraea sp. 3-1Str]